MKKNNDMLQLSLNILVGLLFVFPVFTDDIASLQVLPDNTVHC